MTDIVEVALVHVPMGLYRETSEHTDELQREFSLLLAEESERAGVPARLLDLIEALQSRFGAFTSAQTSALREALARGDERVNLTYRVPPQVKEAAASLDGLLDEADEYCRAGTHLLTLAAPPGVLALRKWFLGEFVRQVDGGRPMAWEDSPYAVGPPGHRGPAS